MEDHIIRKFKKDNLRQKIATYRPSSANFNKHCFGITRKTGMFIEHPKQYGCEPISVINRCRFIMRNNDFLHSRNVKCDKILENMPEQSEVIEYDIDVASRLACEKDRYIRLKCIPAVVLNIPRDPVHCPVCNELKCIVELPDHYYNSHRRMSKQLLKAGQLTTLFLCPKIVPCGHTECNYLILVKNKICGLGESKFRNYIPLLVMTARAKLSHLLGITLNLPKEEDHFLIWVTGIIPSNLPLFITYSVFKQCKCNHNSFSYSGKVYNIKDSQDVKNVFRSGHMILVSASEFRSMTREGLNALAFQIKVY